MLLVPTRSNCCICLQRVRLGNRNNLNLAASIFWVQFIPNKALVRVHLVRRHKKPTYCSKTKTSFASSKQNMEQVIPCGEPTPTNNIVTTWISWVLRPNLSLCSIMLNRHKCRRRHIRFFSKLALLATKTTLSSSTKVNLIRNSLSYFHPTIKNPITATTLPSPTLEDTATKPHLTKTDLSNLQATTSFSVKNLATGLI